jgi:hypothetical protein
LTQFLNLLFMVVVIINVQMMLMGPNTVVNKVLAERLTEGVGVPQNGSSDVLPRFSGGSILSEGRGAHRVCCL